jgi:hypothetical protein
MEQPSFGHFRRLYVGLFRFSISTQFPAVLTLPSSSTATVAILTTFVKAGNVLNLAKY